MSVNFNSPTSFASGGLSGLSISLSPLGLVDISDEEYEVHGLRLNRYALNWSFYLGAHWSYQREAGEPQVTFNFTKAFVDYLATFTFGHGVEFRSPIETEGIVPSRLKRIWEVDNDKRAVLAEVAQHGGVTGDAFIKVAYEEAWQDASSRVHPGRVRILPQHPAHVFPEWHPHDKNRFTRVKIKYRFYGNSPDGARQVYTYTEILEDNRIQEFINDECIRDDPNPLGIIPVVHIANNPIAGSPWGRGDIDDIISLNRLYNETATEIADIINYYAAPVTVILGAKAPQIEKSANKIWAVPTVGADVKNLTIGDNLGGPMEFLAQLKRGMHELAGVPEHALGESQPVSNTSGVALSIQFQPTMMKFSQKSNQYAAGLEKINELILVTLAQKEPQSLLWDPAQDGPLKEGQLDALDPADPLTYITYAHFPSPLPLDKLILLNEVQMKMSLGLESRAGALRVLGEQFPEEKLEEIRSELIDDAKSDGALQLLKTTIAAEITKLTGMMPSPDGAVMPPMDDSGVGTDANGAPTGAVEPQMPQPMVDAVDILEAQNADAIRTELVTEAYGTKQAQRRNPDETPDAD